MDWIEKAAREIDTLLGNAVRENTGVQNGYFSGVSIKDIMNIIEAAQQSVQSDVCACRASSPPTDMMLIDPACPVHGSQDNRNKLKNNNLEVNDTPDAKAVVVRTRHSVEAQYRVEISRLKLLLSLVSFAYITTVVVILVAVAIGAIC